MGGDVLRQGLDEYLDGNLSASLLRFSAASELGYELAHSNAAFLTAKFSSSSSASPRSVMLGGSSPPQAASVTNPTEYLEYTLRAARQGNTDAMREAGDLVASSDDDYTRSKAFYNTAGIHGDRHALFNLALIADQEGNGTRAREIFERCLEGGGGGALAAQ